MSPKPSYELGRAVRLIVATSLTALVLWKAEPSAIARACAHADLLWIGAAVLLVVIDRTLMAYRWMVLLCPIDAADRPPFGAVMRLFFVSTFLGTFLPASVGGDAVRAYGLARLRVARGQAVASVLMDRLLGVLSIVLLGIAGLVAARTSDLASNRAVAISLLAATGVCGVGAGVVFSARFARLFERLAEHLPTTALRTILDELTQATRAYARFHVALVNVLTGSVAVQVLRVLQAYCLGRALAIDAPLAVYFVFVPLILLVMLLPISINGIGTSQVAFVWFFSRVSTPQAEAFALSVLFLGLGVIGNLPGGLLYAFAPAQDPVGE